MSNKDMIYIAICDDDTFMLEQQDRLIQSGMKGITVPFSVFRFTNGKNLLYEVTEGQKPDIVFLDIELSDMNGLDAAKEICRVSPGTLIIFVSQYEKYVYDVFCLQPFRFIPKQQLKERFFEALLSAVNVVREREQNQLIMKNGYELERLPFGEIIMICREGNYVVVHASGNRTFKLRMTLKKIYEKLPAGSFVWISQRICNLEHIRKVKKGTVIMSDGSQLNVPHGAIDALEKTILDFWLPPQRASETDNEE